MIIELINETISKRRTGEEYILLEGLCNNHKLENEDDKLSYRFMDEFLMIQKCIGPVSGIISLTFKEEQLTDGQAVYEQFEEPEVEEVKAEAAPAEGDEEAAPAEEAPPAEEEGAKPKWNPKDFQWTITNRKSKNLAMVYRDYTGASFHSVCKKAEEYGDSSVDQISEALKDFCQTVEDHKDGKCYTQVIFKE